MYCCGECNLRKGDISPPETARVKGIRFFRPDTDAVNDHFVLIRSPKGWILEGKTPVGTFSTDFLDLNRGALIKLRELRHEMSECIRFTSFGVGALRSFPIDQLPPGIKAKASNAIQKTLAAIDLIEDQVDLLLEDIARSRLLDDDPDAEERALDRAKKMLGHKALFPGNWRTPRKPRKHGRD
jgi:hypothetical protein